MLTALSFATDGVPVRRHAPPLRPPMVTNVVARTAQIARQTMVARETKAVVDVLIAYDRGARMWAERNAGSMRFSAETAVWRANRALENTGLRDAFEFRLAGLMCVNDSSDDVTNAICRIRSSCDPVNRTWNAVQRERNRIGADLAILMIDTGTEYGTVGVSYAWESGDDGSAICEAAYSVCAIRAVANCHAMTHEIGHIFGAEHVEAMKVSRGLFNYGHGYYFIGTNGVPYHTIMAYDEDMSGKRYAEAPLFSSPDHEYRGVAAGTVSNDNTRVLLQTCRLVAAFRDRVEEPEKNIIVRFDVNGGEGVFADLVCESNKVYNLPAKTPVGGSGKFRGWFRRDTGKVYDAGVAVFNLAPVPKTIVMEAIWE